MILAALVLVISFFVTRMDASRAYLQLENDSQYTIAPGVLVYHTLCRPPENLSCFSMNFLNRFAPPEYETLAEVGDPTAVVSSLETNPDVLLAVVAHDAPIHPGETVTIPLPNDIIAQPDMGFSYMGMIVETNDGVAWINSRRLTGEAGVFNPLGPAFAEIVDMGTEENEPVGSGFEGGQPDPSRGAGENLDNGVPTEEVVYHHPQFYGDPTAQERQFLLIYETLGRETLDQRDGE